MGMDVDGRNPDSKVGEYFRANVWSWRPIHKIMWDLCSDIIDEKTMVGMGYNQGDGPEDAATCIEIANRIEKWLAENPGPVEIDDADMAVTGAGNIVSKADLAKNPYVEVKTKPIYHTSQDHLREWVEFLKHCGGFRVC